MILGRLQGKYDMGDGRKFLSALVMIDHETVAQFAQERNVPFTNFASLCRAPEVQALIAKKQSEIAAKTKQLQDNQAKLQQSGSLMNDTARALGVNLIGTAGSDEKVELALQHGATHAINYTKENFTERVRELTGGKGVSTVFDSIGKDTFIGSLDCLRPGKTHRVRAAWRSPPRCAHRAGSGRRPLSRETCA